MIIGITGQSGFVGGSVAEALSLEGHKIVSLDKYTRSCRMDKLSLNGCPDELDWVLHFGAATSIQESFDDPFYTYSNNLESTLMALKIADRSKAAFLFMSSYVYGKPEYLPIDEKHPIIPVNPYMGSKIAGEEICRHLSCMLRIPLVTLRGFNIYGDSHIPGRLVSDLLEAVRNETSIILNDPAPRRDYLYIKDFHLLIHKIISQNPVKTGTYNVGYGESYSNQEVAEMARKLSDNKCCIVVKPHPRPQDIMDCTVDVSLVKKTFLWLPAYPLYKGLSELISK